eukprot:CAMPEP_0115683650 /NCGR_PEP_ID=MMETSP0272-20121206/58499_1 /TAXON_ID=71861 /ORGANISM="Scrippsiella trochoidea, Strain CCMP3099" /LENGTH=192 /DNA_ID=CAMNT_0003123103 /DNA_START=12 /DNA_END=591 /DNA_ORIENTATION=-
MAAVEPPRRPQLHRGSAAAASASAAGEGTVARDDTTVGGDGGVAAFAVGAAGLTAAAAASIDGVPDVGSLNAGRKRFVIKIVEDYKMLTTAGSVTDEWLEKTLPKMYRAMDVWAGLQRRSEVPDKYSKGPQKAAKSFEKAAKSKDYAATLAAFQAYLDELPDAGPGGSGKINFDNPTMPLIGAAGPAIIGAS